MSRSKAVPIKKPKKPKPTRRVTLFDSDPQTQAVIVEFLKADPASPTGLVWLKENHSNPRLVSHRKAGSVAGRATGKDKSVTVKGHRVTTARALQMLEAHERGKVLSNAYTHWPTK